MPGSGEAPVFYHVAGLKWRPGEPLQCWNRLRAAGVVTDADWQRPKLPVGHDGGLVCLHMQLAGARWWGRPGETIIRIRFTLEELGKIRANSEEFLCYPDAIPWEWCEVVEVVQREPRRSAPA